MTNSNRKKKDGGGGGGGKVKSGRGSRFSLRNILTTNFLAGAASNANIPIPSTAKIAKDPYNKKRHFSDSDQGLGSGGLSEEQESDASNGNQCTIDCYVDVEPQQLPNGLYECPLCYANVESFPKITSCYHRACSECWKEYLRIQITESRINLTCFQCSKPLHPNDIQALLGDPELLTKYEYFMLRRVLATEPDARWCPDCNFAVIASGCASCPRILCERPDCSSAFCYHCKGLWHESKTCNDAARARNSDLDGLLNLSSASYGSTKLTAETQTIPREEIKPCPRCNILIVKMDDGSCNHLVCAVCGAEFCWLCMKEVSDLHYLSPSGCTFWGRKPWSRKKKLMWQLGTLIGAPLGIALIAGISIPVLLFGIPVWVGRKIHNKMKNSSTHKRNVAISGGVVAAAVVSPVLAGLAIGLGVPILLAYVYGVVPISLCRSGGCGLSKTASGVKFDFDEDNESIGPSAIITHDGNRNMGAPSIGEVSLTSHHGGRGGMRRGGSPDRESASMAALVGESITGSITGNSVGSNSHPPSHNKLEIQADVISTKRHSLSSETASDRLSEINSIDDGTHASTRGLAGSVLSYKIDGNSKVVEDTKSEASCC